MSFIEYETWRIAEGNEEAHHQMIRDWFGFVKSHHAELFAEWKSARYFRQTDRDGSPTGTYIMLFEFHSLEGHHAYKERARRHARHSLAFGKASGDGSPILAQLTIGLGSLPRNPLPSRGGDSED